MKKLCSIFLAFAISFLSLNIPQYSNNTVNAEISNVTVAHMEYMANINSDGAVNSVDASEILSTYASSSVNG